MDSDPSSVRGIEQRVDDRLRAVGHGKHPTIGFCLQRDTAASEPLDRVRGTESMERANQRFLTPWIVRTERTRLETIVRDITTTTTRDLHLLQQVRRLFEDQNRFLRAPEVLPALGTGDRREESRSSSAHNDQIKIHARSL